MRIRRRGLLCVSGELRELRIEIGESAFELFAVTRALAGLQLFFDACAREHQHASLAAVFQLVLRDLFFVFAVLFRLKFLDLTFYCLAFPSPGHAFDSNLSRRKAGRIFCGSFLELYSPEGAAGRESAGRTGFAAAPRKVHAVRKFGYTWARNHSGGTEGVE